MTTQDESEADTPVRKAAAASEFQGMLEEFMASDPIEQRTAWLRGLTAQYAKLEPVLPLKLYAPDESTPEWVQNVEREVADAMLPVARLKDESNLSPKRMGALIGHGFAYVTWMMEYLKAETKRLMDPKTKIPELTPEQTRIAENFIKLTTALHRLAKRGLRSALEQPFDDANEFLLGFSQAFSRKPRTNNASDIGTSATQIYFYMFICWRVVESMQSVHQLHHWLVKSFGPYRIGDLKRVEKVCQRIGLRYRKPGRPKKSR